MLDLGTIRITPGRGGPRQAGVPPKDEREGCLRLEVFLELPHQGQLQIIAEYFSEVRDPVSNPEGHSGSIEKDDPCRRAI
jgi:hypothetical protein